ncbi:hypothetical protein PR048_003068 [Dryococelus australis]|uniref:Uncharacterized protein n=1 Tax=Dryococelus australis TaxID=614101 RepID=A0ABQ9IM04_9NEOP|nr:hypothetical protein PR048_003068 [Dryococelus australis]
MISPNGSPRICRAFLKLCWRKVTERLIVQSAANFTQMNKRCLWKPLRASSPTAAEHYIGEEESDRRSEKNSGAPRVSSFLWRGTSCIAPLLGRNSRYCPRTAALLPARLDRCRPLLLAGEKNGVECQGSGEVRSNCELTLPHVQSMLLPRRSSPLCTVPGPVTSEQLIWDQEVFLEVADDYKLLFQLVPGRHAQCISALSADLNRTTPAEGGMRRLSSSGHHQAMIAEWVCPIDDSRLPQQPPGTIIKVVTFQNDERHGKLMQHLDASLLGVGPQAAVTYTLSIVKLFALSDDTAGRSPRSGCNSVVVWEQREKHLRVSKSAEMKGWGKGRSPRKHADSQRHRQARLPHVKSQKRPRRESNPFHLGNRSNWCRYRNHRRDDDFLVTGAKNGIVRSRKPKLQEIRRLFVCCITELRFPFWHLRIVRPDLGGEVTYEATPERKGARNGRSQRKPVGRQNDFHVRKSGSDSARNRAWFVLVGGEWSTSYRKVTKESYAEAQKIHMAPTTRVERLRIGFEPQQSRSQIFARENRAARFAWSSGFLGYLPFSPPLRSGAAPNTHTLKRILPIHGSVTRGLYVICGRAIVTRTHEDGYVRASTSAISFSLRNHEQCGDFPVRLYSEWSGKGAAVALGAISAFASSNVRKQWQNIDQDSQARKTLSRLGGHCVTNSLAARLVPRISSTMGDFANPMRMIGVSMEQRRNEGAGKWDIPKKTHRPAASLDTIPTCENPGVTRPGIEPGSPWWEASTLSAQPPRPPWIKRYTISLTVEQRVGENQDLCAFVRGQISWGQTNGALKIRIRAVTGRSTGNCVGRVTRVRVVDSCKITAARDNCHCVQRIDERDFVVG